MKTYDAIILGAGAAGLFCAWQAAKRGLKVLVIEKQSRPGLKILISGGGRCNFTNREVTARHYVSQNTHFCKSALAQFSSRDFIQLVEEHKIPYHEKHSGKLFCDHSSKDILNMLLKACETLGVDLIYQAQVKQVEKAGQKFRVASQGELWCAPNLVVATGGLSYPRLGSSDLGYRLAKKFDHTVIDPRPALTALLWPESQRMLWSTLSGISCPVVLKIQKTCVKDEMLFTHRGLSGPAVLRASNYWQVGVPIEVDFLPTRNLEKELLQAKAGSGNSLIKNFLAQFLPKRLAEFFCQEFQFDQKLQSFSSKQIKSISQLLHHYILPDCDLAGYEWAEVTLGGVDTRALSSQTMESQLVSGLYFIGEVVDVTGDLGGYNFQWAWSSAFVAAQKLSIPVTS